MWRAEASSGFTLISQSLCATPRCQGLCSRYQLLIRFPLLLSDPSDHIAPCLVYSNTSTAASLHEHQDPRSNDKLSRILDTNIKYRHNKPQIFLPWRPRRRSPPGSKLVDVSIYNSRSIDTKLSIFSTEPFVSTCSPDELLGQIISTLIPKYNIDAPHLLSLRQVISSAIVAPRKPPTLKRTRPDRRIGEVGSVYNTPRHPPYGPNGPPVSATQSFFFHHQDPDFERLLPQIDRSRYEWPDEPVSESSSDGEEISDSQESLRSMLSDLPGATTQRNVSSQPQSPSFSASAGRRRRPIQRNVQHPRISDQLVVQENATVEAPSIVSGAPQDDVLAPSEGLPTPSVPTIIITSPQSSSNNTTPAHKEISVSSPLCNSGVTAELPEAQDICIAPDRSCPSASPILPYTDTQDTVSSTQQSDVFSQPKGFVNFTPPSQEDTQKADSSQFNTLAGSERSEYTTEAKGSLHTTEPHMSSFSPPATFEPALGKRIRAEEGAAGVDRPEPKRTKSG